MLGTLIILVLHRRINQAMLLVNEDRNCLAKSMGKTSRTNAAVDMPKNFLMVGVK